MAEAVHNAKAGQVRYRTDKAGIIHCPLGKIDFDADKLRENLEALLANLNKAKPSAAKGIYMKKVTVSSTMGPGLTIDHSALSLLIAESALTAPLSRVTVATDLWGRGRGRVRQRPQASGGRA